MLQSTEANTMIRITQIKKWPVC